MLEKIDRQSSLIMPVKPVFGASLDNKTEEQLSEDTRKKGRAIQVARQALSRSEGEVVESLSAHSISLRELVVASSLEIPSTLVRQLYQSSSSVSKILQTA